jgi:hypothetical protein
MKKLIIIALLSLFFGKNANAQAPNTTFAVCQGDTILPWTPECFGCDTTLVRIVTEGDWLFGYTVQCAEYIKYVDLKFRPVQEIRYVAPPITPLNTSPTRLIETTTFSEPLTTKK